MKHKSFTLLEIMVAVVIFMIAAALTIAIAANAMNTRYKTKNIINVQRNAQIIAQYLTQQVNLANACDTYIASEGPVSYFGFRAFNGTVSGDDVRDGLTLKVASVDQFWQKNVKTIQLVSGNLEVTESILGTQPPRNINDNTVEIQNITFTTDANIGLGAGSCMSSDPLPRQNYLKLHLTLHSRIPDPKGDYVINLDKYISAKNFDFGIR